MSQLVEEWGEKRFAAGEKKGIEKGREAERAAYAVRESNYLSKIAELESRLAMSTK